MKRLRKCAEDEEMSFDEIKQETLEAIVNMKKNTHQWAVRDALCGFTHWGFYSGPAMATLDVVKAGYVADELIDYVKSLNESQEDNLLDINGVVSHYLNLGK